MIRYRLACSSGHEFEAWFASSAAYDAQTQAHEILCPECCSAEVAKAIMAPAVGGGERRQARAPERSGHAQFMEFMRHMRRALLAKSEDVGARFPDEARKIHYGEAEERGIRGTASGDEARALRDEGIDVLALPPLPDDAN